MNHPTGFTFLSRVGRLLAAPPTLRNMTTIVPSIMIALGILSTTTGGGLYFYSWYQNGHYQRQALLEKPRVLPGRHALEKVSNDPNPLPGTANISDQIVASSSTGRSQQYQITTATKSSSPLATSPIDTEEELTSPAVEKPRRSYLPPTWIEIPRIKVDSPVVEAEIKNGEWQIPAYKVGRLSGTANPGEEGNSVLTGHVESISSGNVFSRLKDMRRGDLINYYSKEEVFTYQVTDIKIVPYTDLSVLDPAPEPILSLITCLGSFDYLTRNYSHRLVVIAELLS